MYQIALCDDETTELDKTEQMLCAYMKMKKHFTTELKIERFESADELLCLVRERQYAPDLIMMDIYMPEKMGIEAARELRDMGNKGKIIFLTTSKEHALDAFDVEAAQYLVKPILEEKLFPILDKLFEDMEEFRRKFLLLRIDGRIKRVAVNSIVYCEAQGKQQYLHFTDGSQCLLRMTMSEIYAMLSQYREFVRVGIAYVVNLEHIESLCREEIQMDNGKMIYPPRGSFQPLREKYFGYYCDMDMD